MRSAIAGLGRVGGETGSFFGPNADAHGMEIAGKTLRRRVGTALVVFVLLMAYDYATDAPVRWVINLAVPVLYFVVSLGVDTLVQRRFGGYE